MIDHIAQDRLQKERDRFIGTINETNILRLASWYQNSNNNDCYFFKPPRYGRFNVSYFVAFLNDDGGERGGYDAVERPPIESMAMRQWFNVWALGSLVSQKSAIPVPEIIAYSPEGGNFGISSFIILEYIEGMPLSDVRIAGLPAQKRNDLYRSLAEIYIELRTLTFDKIGSLAFNEEGEVEVAYGPVSAAFNTQEMEGLHPSRIRDPRAPQGTFQSSLAYISTLLKMMWNVLHKSPVVTQDEIDAEQTFYYLNRFHEFVRDEWFDEDLSSAPFVLSHCDFTTRNIIVDDDMDIIAVLGWEWSHVVPRQFLYPPIWLVTDSLDPLTTRQFYDYHVEEVKKMCTILRASELEQFETTYLWDEWEEAHENGRLLVAPALERLDLDTMFYFGFRYCDNFQVPTDLVEKFMAQDPARRQLVAKKVRQGQAHDAECMRLRLGEYSASVNLE
ncbi:phosphotransferase enzyme family [Fusarium albosuccineum]|uniref:Phosphotransferase enzyme family n=1 Tax=Fusarium albosuccineum TaxID=1237068 RepID=A0A8H4PB28_9HYPO|nr:phosphotransferase enzyme family [Fusarium albosuccineum]